MAVRGIDHDQIAFGVDQRFGALEPGIAHGRRRRAAQPPRAILGGVGIGHGLFDILDRDQPDAVIKIVYHQQLLDPPRMQQASRFILADPRADRREIFMRHQFADRLARALGKADIAIGENADELAAGFDDGNSRNPVHRHQRLRISKRRVGRDRDRIDNHSRFKAFDLTDRRALLLDRKIAVQHTEPAKLRHDDRHIGLGDRVHRRREDRNVEADLARDPRFGVRLARHHIRFAGLQQHVVKGQSEPDIHYHIFQISSRGGPCNQSAPSALGRRSDWGRADESCGCFGRCMRQAYQDHSKQRCEMKDIAAQFKITCLRRTKWRR